MINHPRFVKWPVFVAAFAIFGLAAAGSVGHALAFTGIARTQVNAIPFTIKFQQYDFGKTAQGMLFGREEISRSSDGSTVTVRTWLGERGMQSGHTMRSMRLSTGEGYWIYDSIGGFTSFPTLSTQELASLKEKIISPSTNCVYPDETFIGYGAVLGQNVSIVESNNPKFGNESNTSWRALSLDCQEMQHRTEVRQSDGSLKLKFEARPVSVSFAEPDSKLFELPQRYKNLKPSEAVRAEAAKLGIEWTSDMEMASKKDDAMVNGPIK